MLNDLRCAFRQLVKSPGFTLLAIVTLGLGIGANTSMYSILSSVLLKPLPYPDSENLDRIYRTTEQDPRGGVSVADYRDLQAEMSGYGEIAAYAVGNTTQIADVSQGDTTLSEPGRPPEVAPSLRVSANFFSVLRVQPHVGRDFRPGEDRYANDRVLIISHRCWQNRFGGRSDIVGHVIRVDGKPHEIVGVLPASFNDWRYMGWVDLFRPLGVDPARLADRRTTLLRVIGHRAPSVSRADADHFIADFGARLAKDHPDIHAGTTWRTVSLNSTVAGRDGTIVLAMLIGLSAFVLLIACSNLANLLLARTIGRAREFAVRAAMGASRVQLLRPLIAESLVLALAGGACAILVAQWMTDWLAVRSTGDNGERVVLTVDWPVMAWAFGAAAVTALAFGLAPAHFALRLNLNDTLKSGARGSTGTRGHQRFRQLLIVGQFTLAMVLLAGAALFIRGLHDLNNRRSGWESGQLVTATVLLPAADYADPEKLTTFQRLTLERLQALPGVDSAGLAAFTPFFNWPDTRKYLVEGREVPQPGHEPVAAVNNVSPRYFEAVGTRLFGGRAFTDRDTLEAPKVFVINEAMARALFRDQNPVGRRIAPVGTGAPVWGEIVGVVADVKPVVPDPSVVTFQIYQPLAQEPRPRMEMLVRAAGGTNLATVVDAIRSSMATLYPDLPVRELQPADTRIYRSNYQYGVLRDILLAFALLGLGLASLGIYGIIARTMAQRSTEFAIRLALGACVRDITRIVLTAGVKLALAGSLLGLVGALAVSHILASSFPGMQLNTPTALIGTTLLLIGIALLACWLPARRAGRVDAVMALRAE